jgi:hypothetical protein
VGGWAGGWVGLLVADFKRKATDELQDMSQGGITHLIPITKGGWVGDL